ncbi:MAG TPA: Hsp20/alpha crystallin family protein [Gemmatimonadaceae bacterium]|jgi:HSP20 family molecular chaperone IbpA
MARQPNDQRRRATQQHADQSDQRSQPETSQSGSSNLQSERQRPIQTGRDTNQRNRSSLFPQLDTFRRGDKLVVRADVPGAKKGDIRIEVYNGILTITSEQHQEHEEDREGFFRSEQSYELFYRALPLPEGVDPDQIQASFNDGVLEIAFPAPAQQQDRAKQVPVK